MEGLVNYSSEDELEDCNYQKAAERGSPRNRGVAATTYASGGRRSGSSNGDGRRSPHSNVTGGESGSNGSGRSTFRGEEGTSRYKTSSSYSGNRSNSSYYSRDNHESKDAKDSRGFKDFGNSNRYNDYKMSERSHSKDNKNDYKRDRETYHNNRRGGAPRDDDRSNRNPSSFSSPPSRGRYGNSNNSRYSFDRNRPHHHQQQQRSNDDRSSTDHYERSERSTVRHRRRSESHSRSRSHSPQNSTSVKRISTRNDTSKPHHSRSYRAHHNDSHSRSRSRSHSRERCTAAQPLEQARLCALEMEHKLIGDDDSTNTTATATIDSKPQQQLPLRHRAALLALPLSDTAPKQPSVIAVATPSLSSNNGEPAVIQLPSYYNPSVINPNKYAEQVQKRKLLWGAKKVEDTAAKWNNAQFSQDSDGKVASKFMRLMGIKGATGAGPSAAAVKAEGNDGDAANKVSSGVPTPDVKSREVMFSNMEQQYEVARQTTHTMRGVGLGFSSQSRPF